MDKLKYYLLMLTAVLVVCPAMADDNGKILVVAGDKSKTYELTDVKRIDFEADGLRIVEVSAEGVIYAFDELQKIVFNPSDADAIKEASADKKSERLSLFVSADGSTINVLGWDNATQESIEIYSASGARMLALARWTGQQINISNLPTGVYIIKVGSRSAKFKK